MSENSNVRVRFAPSPTGYIHLGSLRTALFNYLFARHTGGKFILRIEDTDRTRFVDDAVDNLLASMKLLGLDYDEGPVIGGEYGPYYQSERLDIYKKYALELVEKGFAYYTFETAEELEEMRRMAKLEGRITSYDRRGRNLTPEEVKEKLDRGIPYVIRLKVPLNEEVKFDDIVKGTIRIDTNMVDDQVLMKSDGFPTYHMANVVDDHLMGITHIIRGEEWITSVPKHIILYKAFGWEVPKMAHCPLLLNPDKTKLSKRQGDVAVEDYLAKGYLKEALINFMAFLGWNPGEGETEEIFSIEQLIEKFTLERIQVSGAVFNVDKLDWMNNHYIKDYDLDKLTDLAFPFFEKAGVDVSDREKVKEILDTVRVYLNKLDEIPEHIGIFYNKEVKIKEEYQSIFNENSSKIVLEYLSYKLLHDKEEDKKLFSAFSNVVRSTKQSDLSWIIDLEKYNNRYNINQEIIDSTLKYFIKEIDVANKLSKELEQKLLSDEKKKLQLSESIYAFTLKIYYDTINPKDISNNFISIIKQWNTLVNKLPIINEDMMENVIKYNTIDPLKFKVILKDIQNETGIKGKNLYKPIRIALTGKEDGPELPKIAQIFGKSKTEKFIIDTLSKYS